MQRRDCSCSILQSCADSLTRIVLTRVLARGGSSSRQNRRCTYGAFVLARISHVSQATLFSRNDSNPFLLFSPHGASFFFLRATARPRRAAVFVSLPFAFHCSFVVVVFFLFLLLFFCSLLLRHRVRCCSGPIRETRHDSDISPEVPRGKVDH